LNAFMPVTFPCFELCITAPNRALRHHSGERGSPGPNS
jgi:hypothetical protein